MSGIQIGLKEEVDFFRSLLLPSFDPDNGAKDSAQRKQWMKGRASSTEWNVRISDELIVRYGMFSLEEAKKLGIKKDMQWEKELERENSQGITIIMSNMLFRT